MIKYAELVEYIKKNHVDWNTDLFDVLKGFFDEYSSHDYSPPPPLSTYHSAGTYSVKGFKEPENGEYTAEDLINLFST